MNFSSINSLGLNGAPEAEKAKDNFMKNEMGQEAFLTMLTAQLKNQDPLNPASSTEFTAQLAQFSSLEQMIKVNSNLKGLQLLQSSQNNSSMTNMIGKTIQAEGNGIALTEGEATSLAYTLDANAKAVDIFVYNSDSTIVRQITENDMDGGEHIITWDGKDDNGSDVKDGMYSFSISARDVAGNPVESVPFQEGEVTSLSFQDDGDTMLWIGDLYIPIDSITKVSK